MIELTVFEGHKILARLSMEDFEKDWLEFKIIHNKISVADIDSAKKDDYFKEFNRIKMRYFLLLEQVREDYDRTRVSSVRFNTLSAPTATAFKLDAIKIPKFFGQYEAWATFSSLFKTLVIENRNINDVQKMQYLKSVLAGEAERAVAGLDITEENFEKAWEILVERFDNKLGIREKQVKCLINLESVPSSCPRKVRNLHDKAKEYTALLEGITLNEFIIILIKSKLDTDLQTRYEDQRPENETLKGFFAFLNHR